MRWLDIAAGLVAMVSTAFAQSSPAATPFPTSCSGVSSARYQYTLASNWRATKIAGNLRQPRTIVFDPLGNMLVLQATNGISVHTFGADGCINSTTMLVTNRALNHGLSLTPDGTTLYASGETTGYSWSYDPATRKLGASKVVVKNMGSGVHSTRTMVVVPGHPNLVIVTVGSNNNWDYQAGDAATGRACAKVFDMSKVPDGGYDYKSGGWQLGYGLRNEVAITLDPNNMAWGVENSGDDFRRTVNGASTDIHIDNPAEELNYLGDPTKPNNNWYGYPTCFTVWSPSLIRDKTFQTGDQFVVTPNSSFSDANCATKAIPPRLSFPAHVAPITAAFDADAKNMYITFHGSWDRQPAIGYKVVEVPFTQTAEGQYDPVAKSDSQTGFTDVIAASNPGGCQSQSLTQSSCWRLAGLQWDPAGTRLFVSSDNSAEGEIFVLSKKT